MRTYAGWRIVEFFLRAPSATVYVKELAGSLGMSSFTTSRILAQLKKENILKCNVRARAKFYSLVDNPMVRALKQFRILADIEKARLVEDILSVDEDIVSVALYGSCASGDYDEKSDLDLICISDVKEIGFVECIRQLEQTLKIEINLKVLSIKRWRDIARKDPVFYDNVVRNMVMLHGTSLVVK